MRIYFVGSDRALDLSMFGRQEKLHAAFSRAMREIGQAAAAGRHRPILTTDSAEYLDYHILRGCVDFAQQNPTSEVVVEYYVPDTDLDVPRLEACPDNLVIRSRSYRGVAADRWIAARVEALSDCDVVFLAGGAEGTAAVGTLALNRGVPIVACPAFGGPAREIFNRTEIVLDAEERAELGRPWNSESADALMRIVERLGMRRRERVHSYFLSYLHQESAIADHLELLLLRHGRVVMRDEDGIAVGASLNEEVKSLIQEADTFLAICTDGYTRSDWCMGELDLARSVRGPARRVVILRVGTEEFPIVGRGNLRLEGTGRGDRQLAVLRLLDGERRPGGKGLA